MQASKPSPASRRRVVWLLWLALLVPIAQGAATWHALSHVQLDTGETHGKLALHQTHCDLCLTATAVTGGAMVGQSPPAPFSAAQHSTPQYAVVGAWVATPARAYLSRAPPLALH